MLDLGQSCYGPNVFSLFVGWGDWAYGDLDLDRTPTTTDSLRLQIGWWRRLTAFRCPAAPQTREADGVCVCAQDGASRSVSYQNVAGQWYDMHRRTM